MNKKWYPCELHCHTVHSDGDFTVDKLLTVAKERKLSGIFLTDHNTMSGYAETESEKELSVVKGIEWTTYFGHMLVIDCDSFVDWRDAVPDNIDEKIAQIKEQNGIVGIAHPFQLGTPVCTGGHWDFRVNKWENVSYMEIFSEGSPFINTLNLKARSLWHSLLSKGYRIAPTMGRDWHREKNNIYPSACTYLLIEGEITPEKMKKAVKEGRTLVSAGLFADVTTDKGEVAGDTIESGKITFNIKLDASRHSELEETREITAEKFILCSSEGEKEYPLSDSITFNAKANDWYSLEVWGKTDGKENMLLCLCAPVYTK